MRKILLALAVSFCSAAFAEMVVLDLSAPKEPIEYDEYGVWTGVYKDEMLIRSQEFTFSHVSSSPAYYNGFIASKSTTIYNSANFDDQFGCMAKGGVTGEGTPYLVAYWDTYAESASVEKSCEVSISSPHYVAGFYVCNSPYVYYTIQRGNGFASKFGQGAWFKLIAHGLDSERNETGTVEYYLADYRSDNPEEWTLNNSWDWFDLSSLGKVSSIYFSMESSDVGEYGMKTPGYFCMDQLTALTAPLSVEKAVDTIRNIYYDRDNSVVRVESARPVTVAVYDTHGVLMMKQSVEGSASLDMSTCSPGIYVVCCGEKRVKIVK